MKRKTWRSKLTKKELNHLKESGVTSKATLEHNFSEQCLMRKANSRIEPCHECKAIAMKLGYAV